MLTAEEIADIRSACARQPGCADKTCRVCVDNARRTAAAEKAISLAEHVADVVKRIDRTCDPGSSAQLVKVWLLEWRK